jgi:nicotinamidase-related amidase
MTDSSNPTNIIERSAEFIGALAEWESGLPELTWHEAIAEVPLEQVALFSVDMINGFCHQGSLASPRIKAIIPQIVEVFNDAYAAGVRNFVLAQDSHTPDAAEFACFPPHCQTGSAEAQTIPELAALPFAHLYQLVHKNSLDAFYDTSMQSWLDEHHDLRTAVVVGNCTDLCVYQMAMHLKLYANAHDLKWRVIIPANAVQTYDTPLETARELSILPHNGDVLHLLFLYHMRLNGVEIVRSISAR